MFESVKKKYNDVKESISEGFAKQIFIDGLLKSIKPLIPKATESFNEFLGDDEKIIMIRKIKGSNTPTIFVTTVENLKIEIYDKAKMNNFSVGEGIEKVMSGKLFEELEEKDKEIDNLQNQLNENK